MGPFQASIAAWTEKAGLNADSVVAEVVREVGSRLIERSPVKSGKFASNWRYGLESPDTVVTTATNIRVLNNLAEMPVKPAGFIHYLTNSLPYGPALERGHSAQAPQGMVGLTVLEFSQIVAAAAARVAG